MLTVRNQSLWPWAAVLASLMMLAGAFAFEYLGEMPPCQLCLRQREVYYAAIAVGVGGLLATRWWPSLFVPRATAAILAVVFFAGAGVALFHAGVEHKIFPPLAGCEAGASGQTAPASADDLWASITSGKPMRVASCTDAPWSMFGVSMAGYNGLISIVLAVISAAFALVQGRPPEAKE